jgi:hypothetical protein
MTHPYRAGGLVEKLDLATVVKMSHAASEEIVLSN